MGKFRNRHYLENILPGFLKTLAMKYKALSDERCPTLSSKLPLTRQGVCISLAYGTKLFFVLSRDSKYPPYSFVQSAGLLGTWDESEYAELSVGNCIDDIVRILELEQVIYWKTLDSDDPEYLAEALSGGVAGNLAEQLLEEHIQTLQPDFEGGVNRMVQAYDLLFRLENKLRMLIESKLREYFGENDWWARGATRTARDKQERRQQDPRRRWHLLKDTGPLNLVDFEDLHDIIVNKNKDIFEQCISPLDRFSVNMKSLEIPRNIVAHNGVLPQDEYYVFRRTTETLLRIIEANLS